ncbi:MAG: hypothetical protein ACTTK5_00005 [Candidatus Fimenecus sp.]
MKKTLSLLLVICFLFSILNIFSISKPIYFEGNEFTKVFTAATLTDENGKIINTVYPNQEITLNFYLKTKQNERFLKNLKTYICYNNDVLSYKQFSLSDAFNKINPYTNEPLIKNEYPKCSEHRMLENSNQYDLGFYKNFYMELTDEYKTLINSYHSFEIDTNLNNTLNKEELHKFALNQNDIKNHPSVSFKFKVNENVSDGKKSIIMLPDTLRHFQNFNFLYYDDYDEDTFEEIISNDKNLSANTKIYFTVDELSHTKNQIRFTSENKTVSDSFKFRTIVSIPDCVWDKKYNNTATDINKNKIISIGFVAAKESNKNFDEVKLSVEQNNSMPDGWKIGTTNTIYKMGENTDAKFCCLLNLSKSTLTEDIIYIPFIKYLDSEGKEKWKWTEKPKIAPVVSRYEYALNKYFEIHK